MLRSNGFDNFAIQRDLSREALYPFNNQIFDCEDFLTGQALYDCLGLVPNPSRRH